MLIEFILFMPSHECLHSEGGGRVVGYRLQVTSTSIWPQGEFYTDRMNTNENIT